MSEPGDGYGPPGPRHPNMLRIHSANATAMGTEIILLLDDTGWIERLYISFPPDDPEWQDKFLNLVEGGSQPLRSCSVVVPPGQPIIAFRPIDAQGEAIPELCCMYRLVQQDWLKDVAPERKVAELVTGVEKPLSEAEEIHQRLHQSGNTYNCCLCGTYRPEENGYHFDELSGDQVRALRIMSRVAKEFPFVCKPCYRKKMGLSQQALGSATWLQGVFMAFLVVCLRGYIMALLGANYFRLRNEVPLAIAAALGTLISFEEVPGMIARFMKHPLMMVMLFLAPVGLGAVWVMRPSLIGAILGNPLGLIGFKIPYLNFPVMQKSFYGSLAGFILGMLLGTVGPGAKKKKKTRRKPKTADEILAVD